MTQKQKIILGILVVFLVIGLTAGFFVGKQKKKGAENSGENTSSGVYSSEVPVGAVLTVPRHSAPNNPNPEAKTRSLFFDLRITKNGFSPNTFTVQKGDTLQIDVIAVDGTYDIEFPYLGTYFNPIPQGEVKRLPVNAPEVGKFLFRCRDYCPSSGAIEGTLIVLEREQ